MIYRFGPFLADRTSYRALKGDTPLELTPKLLDLLFYLLERPATLVTKEALLDGVWPDANVTDNALAQAVSELREALGDAASAPTYIRTVARRGYRFIAPVEVVEETRDTRRSASPASGGPAVAQGPGAIAVLDFTNVTGDADVEWLATGIAETVTNDLAALAHFRVIDRWRVGQAARQTDGSVQQMGAALSAPWLVTGSYQRSGANLRITARVVDLTTDETRAEAKVDGRLDDVFTLQDGIVTTLARDMGVGVPAARHASRETASLEAYRAHTEGWLKIESLDTRLIPAAIEDFELAVRLDPSYAPAHTGLGSASFVAYEMTRATLSPDLAARDAGIEHARRAIRLDDGLAEAHATLSFLLVSAARFDEARESASRAVTLEPESWRHQYRLGHAQWGTPRLEAFGRAVALYPQFSYAHFEATMVHVARGQLELALDAARQGASDQQRQAQAGRRFPAIGFHWLLGALASAQGRHADAMADFDRELAQTDPHRLYGPEYGALALIGRGHAQLALGDADAALHSFGASLGHVAGHPRACLGQALAYDRLGRPADRDAALNAARTARARFEDTGRLHDARYVAACEATIEGHADEAARALDALLTFEPASFYGWTLPIEPCLASASAHPGIRAALDRLADRAR